MSILQRLSELAPDLCRQTDWSSTHYHLCLSGLRFEEMPGGWAVHDGLTMPDDQAKFVQVLLSAIAHHGLLVRMENTGKGEWHVAILGGLKYVFADHPDNLAIAICRAYVAWLEFKRSAGVAIAPSEEVSGG